LNHGAYIRSVSDISKDPAEKQLHSLRATAGCRFNAAKRLASKDRALTRITAFTSAYVILLTVLPYFIKLPTSVADVLNFITIIFSLAILVSSLLQYSSGDTVSAEQHHRAGLEINEIQRHLAIKLTTIQPAELDEVAKKFDATLQKYSINHEDVDFLRYQLDHPEEYPFLTKPQLRWRAFLTFYWQHIYLGILVLITCALIYLIVGYAYPNRDKNAATVKCSTEHSVPLTPPKQL